MENLTQPQLNSHNKDEYPPMHTAEHILNATMVKMFGCQRSANAHIERKKSKCDYRLAEAPTDEQISEIEERINGVIERHLPVTVEFMEREKAAAIASLSKLPDDASQTIRIVRVGDYDTCACIGSHVSNTGEIGRFKIISSDFTPPAAGEETGTWRVRFRLLP